METRKIVIVSTKTQKKSVIMSAATTLAELKTDLEQNDIDYEGMTFYEGISKVELKDDNSLLPHDVPYKGKTTNELVFMLTNTNKKIKSGACMTRSEIYAAIKNGNLQKECIKRFGKNFTMCKTDDLLTLIDDSSTSLREMKAKTKNAQDSGDENNAALTAIQRLLIILNDNGMINDCEVKEIEEILNGRNTENKQASSYSTEEIDEMFNFVK